MPSMAQVLKKEMARIARKEIKPEISELKSQMHRLRKQVWELKRENTALEKKLARVKTGRPRTIKTKTATIEGKRVGPKSIKAQRKRLLLSQADLAKLLGVSPNTVWHWEAGKMKPRKGTAAKLIGLRDMSPEDVKEELSRL